MCTFVFAPGPVARLVDGVFEAVALEGEGEGEGEGDADVQASPPGVVFHPASAIDAAGTADGVAVGELWVVQQGNTVPPKQTKAQYLWAVLIAHIYKVFPLLCPMCGGQMRLIAFVTEGTQIKKILDHIGVDSEPPHISPARGPPLWDDCGDA